MWTSSHLNHLLVPCGISTSRMDECIIVQVLVGIYGMFGFGTVVHSWTQRESSRTLRISLTPRLSAGSFPFRSLQALRRLYVHSGFADWVSGKFHLPRRTNRRLRYPVGGWIFVFSLGWVECRGVLKWVWDQKLGKRARQGWVWARAGTCLKVLCILELSSQFLWLTTVANILIFLHCNQFVDDFMLFGRCEESEFCDGWSVFEIQSWGSGRGKGG